MKIALMLVIASSDRHGCHKFLERKAVKWQSCQCFPKISVSPIYTFNFFCFLLTEQRYCVSTFVSTANWPTARFSCEKYLEKVRMDDQGGRAV
jgi:hypothetical protein